MTERSFSLLWLSSLAGGLLVARIAYSHELRHAYLLWNLCLAWLPLIFAGLVCRSHSRLVRGFSGLLWLLFLPNAPYLITDLIHLAPSGRVPLWYDALLLFTAALGGLLLGLHSLHLMHGQVTRHLGAVSGWLFVLVVSPLAGAGVYIGRFLRWNSWDALLRPASLAADLVQVLGDPALGPRMLLFVLLFTLVSVPAYLFLLPPSVPAASPSAALSRRPAEAPRSGALFRGPLASPTSGSQKRRARRPL